MKTLNSKTDKANKTGVTTYKSTKSSKAGKKTQTQSYLKDIPVDLFNQIQLRAYYLFCDRTEKLAPGTHFDDWLKAEKEIKRKYKIK